MLYEVITDPIDRVIFQEPAKRAIRKTAQNRGHILMVGGPGTGKSMLANMVKEVLQKSLGDYLRPRITSYNVCYTKLLRE